MKRAIQLGMACLAVLVAAAGQTEAGVITFDTQPEQYFVPQVIEGDYKFKSDFDGFGTNNDPLWPSNGTKHLMSWTNSGSVSGFTLTRLSASLMYISSFDFAGGYNGGQDPVTSLTVEGFLAGNLISSVTFIGGVDFSSAGPNPLATLNLVGFNGIDSLVVRAFGSHNRAQYDNFVVSDAPPAAVPEPSSLVLFGLGACFAASARLRRRRQQTTVAA